MRFRPSLFGPGLFAMALVLAPVSSRAEPPEPDLLNATLGFSSGLEIQSIQVSHHLLADDPFKMASGAFRHYVEDRPHVQEKLPFSWIFGFTYMNYQLPPQAGVSLVDETMSLKVGADWQVTDSVDVGSTLSFTPTPVENFNAGKLDFWMQYLFALHSRTAPAPGAGGDEEDAAAFFKRVNKAKESASVPLSGNFPQFRIGLDLVFGLYSQGAENPTRVPTGALTHGAFTNQSATTLRFAFIPAAETKIWVGVSYYRYSLDPSVFFPAVQLSSRPPTDLALAELQSFSDAIIDLPLFRGEAGLSIGFGPSAGLDFLVIAEGTNYGLSRTASAAAMLHFDLAETWRLGLGLDLTESTIANAANMSTATTGAISLGYLL